MSFSIPGRLGALLLTAICLFAQSAPKEVCDASATFETAKALLGKKLYDEATRSLDNLRICPTLLPVERFQLGWLYGRARNFHTALQIFQLVPSNIPSPTAHAYAIALSQFELADYKGSAATLETLQSQLPLDPQSANLLAVSLSKAGLYREAYTVLSNQLQRSPNDLTSYLNLITVCAEGGDVKTGADVATRAIQAFPTSSEVFLFQGAADILLGQLEDAHRAFGRSRELAPDRPDVYFFLALTDYKEGNFANAITLLQSAIQQGLKDSDLHYLLAECLLKRNPADTEIALQQLDRALEINGDSISAHILRGKLLLEKGHPDQAVPDLEFAKQHDPDSRSATYTLARAYSALGRTSAAQMLFHGLRDQPSTTLGEMSDRRLNDVFSSNGKPSQ